MTKMRETDAAGRPAHGTAADRKALLELADDYVVRHGGPYLETLIERAEGSWIYDTEGRRILDFTSGQMCSTLGHNHPAVVAAIEQSCRTALHLFSWMLSPVVIELCRNLAALLPPELRKTLLLSTGGEANEAAIKMAKLYTGRWEVVGIAASWHGATQGAASHTYAGMRRGYGPLMPGAFAIPTPNAVRCPIRHCDGACDCTCLEVGFEMFDTASNGAPAAFIAEPIISAGGLIVPPPDYFKRCKSLCEARGMLMILDEAQTGLGRTGSGFAFEHFGVVPDLLTLSKTLGGGLPLSATVTSAEIEQACYEKKFLHVTSHVNDPLPAAVGLTVLELLVRDRLQDRARRLGERLSGGLAELHRRYEVIGDLRGMGLLQGVELVTDRHSWRPNPELGAEVTKRCLERGLSMNIVNLPGMSSVWRIAPPLTVTEEEIDLGLSIIDEALRDSL